MDKGAEPRVLGNVTEIKLYLASKREDEPAFTSDERAALRRVMRQMEQIRKGCPTARWVTSEP